MCFCMLRLVHADFIGKRKQPAYFSKHLFESCNGCLSSLSNAIRREVELLKKTGQRSRLSKGLHSNVFSIQSNILVPSKVTCEFNSNTCSDLGGEDGLLVLIRLLFKEVEGGHGNNTRLDSLGNPDVILMASGSKKLLIRMPSR